MIEEWRDVPDIYTRSYQVSNIGRVRSLDFTYYHRSWKRTVTRKGQIVRCSASGKKHYKTFQPTLKNGDHPFVSVHTLVAEAFLGPNTDSLWVLHKDGNAFNNRADNLYYGTPSQNTHDAYQHGTLKRGHRHHKAKLTEEDVLSIRREPGYKGITYRLAEQYGVDLSLIGYIT